VASPALAPIGQKAQPAAAGLSRKAAEAITTTSPPVHAAGDFLVEPTLSKQL